MNDTIKLILLLTGWNIFCITVWLCIIQPINEHFTGSDTADSDSGNWENN